MREGKVLARFNPSRNAARNWRLSLVLLAGSLVLPGATYAEFNFLWQDKLDVAGGDDFASDVAALKGYVFVGGGIENAQQNDDLAVRAYKAETGQLVWDDRFDLEGLNDGVNSVAARKGGVFAAGLARSALGGTDWIVRALDAKTGAFRWQDVVDKTGGIDVARAVTASGKRVFAAGETRETINNVTNIDGLVRAYDAHSGQLLWEDQHDQAGGFDTFSDIATSHGRVFVAGNVEDSGGDDEFMIRAYDARTGLLLWDDIFDPSGQFDRAFTVAARGHIVVVGGETTNSQGNRDFTVVAYSAATGTRLWHDQFDLAGSSDSANAVTIQGWWVYAAGSVRNAAGNSDFFVRAYSAWSGSIRWDDQHDEAGGSDLPLAIAATSRAVFVAGSLGHPGGNSDFALRAYAPFNGNLLGQDKIDTGDFDRALGVVAHGGTAYTAGFVQNGSTDFDWLARAVRLPFYRRPFR